MRRSRGRRSTLTRLALGCVFALALLWVAEIGLRLAGVGPAYQEGATGSWRMTPDLHASELRGPRDGHSFRVTTNAHGLRTSLPLARTPGVARVALMGDSTVFGWGVDDGGAVADGLQAELDRGGAGRVEVLNAGQPGYSTTQVAWLFDEVVAKYRPDRLVVFISMHDFNRVLVSDREHLEGAASPAAWARLALVRHSRIYQVLRRALWSSTEQAMLMPDQRTGEPRVERVSDADRGRAFDALRAHLAEWGGKLMIGYLPFQADLSGFANDRPGLAFARAYAAEHGVDLVDVRACCGPHAEGLVLPDDPGHLTAEGNRRVGAAIAPIVATSLGLSAGSGEARGSLPDGASP